MAKIAKPAPKPAPKPVVPAKKYVPPANLSGIPGYSAPPKPAPKPAPAPVIPAKVLTSKAKYGPAPTIPTPSALVSTPSATGSSVKYVPPADLSGIAGYSAPLNPVVNPRGLPISHLQSIRLPGNVANNNLGITFNPRGNVASNNLGQPVYNQNMSYVKPADLSGIAGYSAPPPPAAVTGGRGSILPSEQAKAQYFQSIGKNGAAYNLPVGSPEWYDYMNRNTEQIPWYYFPVGSDEFYGRHPANQNAADVPPVPPPPVGDGAPVGDGGGGASAPQKPTWTAKYSVEGAPSWWRGFLPDVWNPETEYMSLLNSMIPYLSPEDQQIVGMNIGTMSSEFGDYGKGTMPPPSDLETSAVQKMYGSSRARAMLGALGNMAAASGRKTEDWGPGKKFLEQISDVLGSYAAEAGGGMSRANYRSMLGMLDPMISGASGGNLAAFGNLAKMLALPYFSGGNLQDIIMGKANTRYF